MGHLVEIAWTEVRWTPWKILWAILVVVLALPTWLAFHIVVRALVLAWALAMDS